MKNSKRTSAFCLLALALAAIVSPAHAKDDRPDFTLPSLADFTGDQWDALQLGKSTAESVKDHYKIAKHGNAIPWSLMLSTPKGSGDRLNVLFDGGDDKKDVATALLIRYDQSPSLESIKKVFGHAGVSYYLRGRNTGWVIHEYPEKGVVLFADTHEGFFTVSTIMLVPPAILAEGCLDLSPTGTLIAPVVDVHAGEPRLMYFGNVDVTTSLDGMTVSDLEKSNLRDELRRATGAGTMIYQEYATGSCVANIHGVYKPDTGDCVDVTVTIDGASPYGPIHAVGASSTTIKQHQRVTDSANYEGVFNDALTKAQQSFALQMRSMGPPTPEEMQRIAYNDVFNRLRAATISLQGIHSAPPPADLWAVPK
ncbi:hypothetical protein CCAX7_17240 [Capsulimonas corticalis]|uniref:Uncharacterized protein n=1 Tax=Capsulimonas corticalis TaxID=2219043 RepID=A0A402D444_9BACT|nr:hypothetical protein [Capsulimonas corticalis]BDI29673.1 hypothetical protein CCAX7_17240 [Capsulimonas corticalis]